MIRFDPNHSDSLKYPFLIDLHFDGNELLVLIWSVRCGCVCAVAMRLMIMVVGGWVGRFPQEKEPKRRGSWLSPGEIMLRGPGDKILNQLFN